MNTSCSQEIFRGDRKSHPSRRPLFFVSGSQDVNFGPSEKVRFERVGADRGASNFVYEDVLFLILRIDAPATKDADNDLISVSFGIGDAQQRAPRDTDLQ